MATEEVVEHFWAVSEDGSKFEILVYAPIISAGPLIGDPGAPQGGGPLHFRTSNGYDVNRLDDDHYVIVDLGLRLTRIR